MTNRVFLSGRLAYDPEVRTAGNQVNGRQFVTLRVITDEGYRNRETGEWIERNVGHDIVVGSPDLMKYVRKWGWQGRWTEVETKLLYRERKEDGVGTGIFIPSLTAHYVRFPVRHDGSKEPERQEPSQAPSHSNSRQASAPPPPSMSADDADDEIPF
ncbi:hypothetical protein AD951_04445 [Acetobacter malorum]|uniref:Single-stranded DNA-binding protein n=1 Tax=Acetobacter malorum TaxID=178901 RepID=A0A149UPU1_9PROT|nr:single-stranded DNA-binding protein [Acetobacter malorum]KXV69932.1 hypothetical protein AD951_04445 [Acetobacter malorum]